MALCVACPLERTADNRLQMPCIEGHFATLGLLNSDFQYPGAPVVNALSFVLMEYDTVVEANGITATTGAGSSLTIARAGRYQLEACQSDTTPAANQGGIVALSIQVNGQQIVINRIPRVGDDAGSIIPSCSRTMLLAAGDVVNARWSVRKVQNPHDQFNFKGAPSDFLSATELPASWGNFTACDHCS